MLCFFNPPPQDVEMAIHNVPDVSTDTASSSVPTASHNKIVLDPKNTPKIFAFLKKQKQVIKACMGQVSYHLLMNIEDTIYQKK